MFIDFKRLVKSMKLTFLKEVSEAVLNYCDLDIAYQLDY